MDQLTRFLPPVGALAVGITVLVILHHWFTRGSRGGGPSLRHQVILTAASGVALLIVLFLLPFGEGTRGHLLSFLGIVFSAALALSSTNFLGNLLAGLMLRAIRSFRIGDFIRVGEHFGRVSERGLFHTEIQTEESDLTTLPNLHLVSNPVTTVRAAGTIVSATVSLGYDNPRSAVEARLLRAAARAELNDPFVQILELGDFSVQYRVAGLLEDVKHLVSARSRLRRR